MRLFAEQLIVLILLAIAAAQPGCIAHHRHGRGRFSSATRLLHYSPQAAAKEELARAAALESAGDAGCVDAYFRACSHLWEATSCESLGEPPSAAAFFQYND